MGKSTVALGLMKCLGVLTMGAAFLFLSGCNSTAGNSLAGSYVAKETCPESGCVDSTPSADKLYIGVSNGQSIQVRPAQKVLELAGDCSGSTYPQNKIVITFDSTVFHAYYPAQVAGGRTELRCTGGRYLAVFAITDLLTTTSFQNIDLEIIGIDSESQEIRSDVGSLQTIQVIRVQ